MSGYLPRQVCATCEVQQDWRIEPRVCWVCGGPTEIKPVNGIQASHAAIYEVEGRIGNQVG